MSVRRLAAEWNTFAERDPFWAVLTWPDKSARRWSADEFFATGEAEIAAVMAMVDRCCPGVPRARALDFGCGVGRLTRALAARFEETHGVDVAARMIDLARGFMEHRAIRFHVNEAPDLGCFGDGEFDFVYSSITLQHLPQAMMRRYLAEFVRILAPGGALVFQLPDRPVRARRSPLRRVLGRVASDLVHRWRTLRNRYRGEPTMDMRGMPRRDVEKLLTRHGCRVAHVEPSTMAGPDWVGYLYFAQRVTG